MVAASHGLSSHYLRHATVAVLTAAVLVVIEVVVVVVEQRSVGSAQHHVDGGAAVDVALALHAAGAEGQQRPHAGHLLVAGAGAAGVHAALLVDALAAAGNLMSSNTSTIRVSKLNMASTVAINKEAQKE